MCQDQPLIEFQTRLAEGNGWISEVADLDAGRYAQTVAAGASEHMRSRMLPLINSSRRCLSLSEVGEGEALRLQANLAIMRETLLGRRRVIEEDEGDSDSDSDSDSDED